MENSYKIHRIDLNSLSPYLRFIHLDNIDSKRFYVPLRILYDYEIYYIVNGKMAVTIDDEEILLSTGDIHVMPPFCWHQRHIPQGASCTYFSIHFDLLYNKEEDFDPNKIYRLPCDLKLKKSAPVEELTVRNIYAPKEFEFPRKLYIFEQQKMLSLLNELLFNFTERPLGYELVLKSDLLNVIKMIMNQLEQNSHQTHSPTFTYQSNIVMDVQNEINKNYNQKLNFTQIAKKYTISPAYLRAIFRKMENISLSAYLTNIRIEKAKSLLAENKYSITEISEMVGYNDVQTFSRFFKKNTSYSPQHYVKNCDKTRNGSATTE